MLAWVAGKRKKALGLPPRPADFHFEIPATLMAFSDRNLFVLHDSGRDDLKRIILLGDQGIRQSLSSVQTIDGDGTFDRCPLQHEKGWVVHKFSQCYVLLAEREGLYTDASGEMVTNRVHIPILHALLPGKDEDTYVRFELVRQVYPELRPTRFSSDYEKAATNAVQRVYQEIVCEGDSFHFVYNITKKLQAEKIDRLDQRSGKMVKKSLLSLYCDDIEIYDQARLSLKFLLALFLRSLV
jgi:hypothetical protein